jgi:predicted secreted protein
MPKAEPMTHSWVVHVALSALALSASCAASAQTSAPSGVVNLSTTASVDVTRDVLSVTLRTAHDGADPQTVQSQLKQDLDAALGEARKAVRPGQLDVHTGSFSLAPRYSAKGAITGWQGSAELTVEGRDLAAIGQLSARLTTLAISRVGYTLSRELRERSEAEVSSQAISRYRALAAEYAAQFGYSGYALREVSVNTNSAGPVPRAEPAGMRSMALAPDEPLPVEPGKGTVSVTVSGSVQLLR